MPQLKIPCAATRPGAAWLLLLLYPFPVGSSAQALWAARGQGVGRARTRAVYPWARAREGSSQIFYIIALRHVLSRFNCTGYCSKYTTKITVTLLLLSQSEFSKTAPQKKEGRGRHTGNFTESRIRASELRVMAERIKSGDKGKFAHQVCSEEHSHRGSVAIRNSYYLRSPHTHYSVFISVSFAAKNEVALILSHLKG